MKIGRGKAAVFAMCKGNYIYVHTMKLGHIFKAENAW
jgi:hypothetical protein